MVYLLLVVTVFVYSYQSILKKEFNKRCSRGIYTHSAILGLAALAVFLIINRDFDVTLPLILYSIAFAVSHAAATVCTIFAIRYGSLAKTSLIISYSLVIPTVYGLITGDPINAVMIIGFALLVISLFLTNYTPKKDTAQLPAEAEQTPKRSNTLLWVIFMVIGFFGNGMCSVIQKMEQVSFEGDPQSNLFMVIALAVNVVMMTVLALISEKKEVIKDTCKKTWWIAVICGIMNGLTNYFILTLNHLLPPSILFPIIAAGGIIFTFLYSLLVYRERFKPMQIVGFILGIGSIILLNL